MTTASPAFDLGRNRLVLLGTKGGPNLRPNSPLPTSYALVWNNKLHVIDAGYGVSLRLVQAGLPVQALDTVFVTHHHSDHSLELGVLLQNAWLCGLKTPVQVYGPRTTKHLIAHTQEAFRFDIEIRMVDEGRPDIRKMVHVEEFGLEGDRFVILDTAEMKVSALRNLHPPVTDSFAFRFDLRGAGGAKSIVLSGDTAYFPPLAEFAKGADLLVHEVMYGPGVDALVQRNPNAARIRDHLFASHTLAEDVGRIATQAGVRKLALNHFVPADDPALTPQLWREAAAKNFAGEIIPGVDLMEFDL
ncbi:MAG: MBL fold metallo-hydrolase [Alphaproteobacteria bacterium]|nr:MBL fold metallo-hydrolase [Alphaproteobacteria bacterium]